MMADTLAKALDPAAGVIEAQLKGLQLTDEGTCIVCVASISLSTTFAPCCWFCAARLTLRGGMRGTTGRRILPKCISNIFFKTGIHDHVGGFAQ